MLGQAAGSSESDSPSNARIPPTRPPAAQGRGAADGAESEWSSDESITPESGHRTLYDRLMVTPQAPLTPPLKGFEDLTFALKPTGAFTLTYKTSEHTVEELLDRIRAAGVTIKDLSIEEPDLEDVFVELTA